MLLSMLYFVHVLDAKDSGTVGSLACGSCGSSHMQYRSRSASSAAAAYHPPSSRAPVCKIKREKQNHLFASGRCTPDSPANASLIVHNRVSISHLIAADCGSQRAIGEFPGQANVRLCPVRCLQAFDRYAFCTLRMGIFLQVKQPFPVPQTCFVGRLDTYIMRTAFQFGYAQHAVGTYSIGRHGLPAFPGHHQSQVYLDRPGSRTGNPPLILLGLT
jgi:hypothetical protein